MFVCVRMLDIEFIKKFTQQENFQAFSCHAAIVQVLELLEKSVKLKNQFQGHLKSF